ncbi:MAG: hypothetical protein LRY73_17065 [Bacillus sp. (in: Bacteria)]|nr:hypothetical protein [Bacillus sp. (in: firmicutes)]
MAYTVIFGIVLGQIVCRITYSKYVGMFDWTHKFFNYIIVPLIVSFHYWIYMSLFLPQPKWGLHYMVGLFLGFVVQFFIVRIRKEYFSELFQYDMNRENQKSR